MPIALPNFVKIIFIFVLVFTSGLRLWAVNFVASCQQLFHNSYLPKDFALSHMGKHFDNQDQYRRWAAAVSNLGLELLENGRNFKEVFGEIARQRGFLAFKQRSEKPSEFGRQRRATAETGLLDFDKAGVPPLEKQNLLSIIEKRFKTEKIFRRTFEGLGDIADTIVNHYTFIDGKSFPATELGRTEYFKKHELIDDGMDDPILVEVNQTRQRYIIFHLDMGISNELQKDAIERLNWIKRNHHRKIELRHDMFIRSMFALYNAMPFTRGSASIAKVFFASSYLHLFGKKNPQLPEDIDVLAMIMTEQDFIRILMSRFNSVES